MFNLYFAGTDPGADEHIVDIGANRLFSQANEKTRIEKSQVNDITTDQARIDFIVKTLMRNNVTPVHLYDVIVDML